VIVSLRELEDGVPETKQTPQVRGRLFSMQRWLDGFAAAHTAVARMIDQANGKRCRTA
jgi:hypothetical protein